jgi:hypothetical protein
MGGVWLPFPAAGQVVAGNCTRRRHQMPMLTHHREVPYRDENSDESSDSFMPSDPAL